MKHLSYITLVAILYGCAVPQPKFYPVDNQEFTVSKISKNLPFSKNQLYLKSNYWVVDYFTNPKEVIQYSDKEEGVIKGIYKNYFLDLQFTIQVKDSTAQIDFKPRKQLSVNEKGKTEIVPMLKRKIQILILSYHKKMQEE